MWGLKAIKAPEAWDITTGSPNVIIAVIDTGVDYEHPELKEVVLRDIDKGYDFPDSDYNPMDDYANGRGGHGTHVAGIIAAKSNNNTGIAGVCWQCKIMAIKIFKYFEFDPNTGLPLDDHITSLDWLVNGIKYAGDHGAHIVNMSFGGPVAYAEEVQAIDYIVSKGVIAVAAAGKRASMTFLTSPALHHQVIAVGSVTSEDGQIKISSFSDRGPKTDAWAPGEWILSLRANNTDLYSKNPNYIKNSRVVQEKYYVANGTSMAAPHVAGIIGLMKSVNPNLTPSQAIEIIHRADEGPLIDGISNGLINARRAVELAQNPPPYNNPPNPPVLEMPSEVYEGQIANFKISNLNDIESNKLGVGLAWITGEECNRLHNKCWYDEAFKNMAFGGITKGSYIPFQRKFALEDAYYEAYLVSTDQQGKSSPLAGPFRVYVKGVPNISNFRAVPNIVSPGERVTLMWNIDRTQRGNVSFSSCQASSTDGKWSGSKSPSEGGFEHVYPTTSVTYTLTCTDPYGHIDSASVHVTVSGYPNPPLNATIESSVVPPYYVGQELRFRVVILEGGTGQYTYQWSGACESEEQECRKVFDLPGLYTTDVWVISGSERLKLSLNFTVYPLPENISFRYTLNVLKQGSGSGTVTGPGIYCGLDCSESYDSGTQVTLTATPASGSVFSHWSGCDSTQGNYCQVTMSGDKTVSAYFSSGWGGNTRRLTVQKIGGLGLVISDDPNSGINCGQDCTEDYTYGMEVGLMAIPDQGYRFSRWSPNCRPNPYYPYICSVRMTSDQLVTAYFEPVGY